MAAALEGAEWSAARPGRTLLPGKTWYPFYRRLGGPVWTDGKSRPHRDSIPDRPGRSQSLYQLSYPDHSKYIFTQSDGFVSIRRAVVPLLKVLCNSLTPSTFNSAWDSNRKTEILPAYRFQRYNVKTSI